MKTLKDIIRGISIALLITGSMILISSLLAGCGTPQKRLDRLVKKHPHLSRIDTVKVTDTFEVMVPGIRADTNITKPTFLSSLKDTIILQKEQLTVKIYEYRDSIFINAQCDTVYKTVVREVKVPYQTITPSEPETKWYEFWWLSLIGALGVFLLRQKKP